jgi:23S rRNA (uracil1939-C5)-methyltransferase
MSHRLGQKTRRPPRAALDDAPPVVAKAQRLETDFHALSASGDAVGRDAGGRTVFAPLAAPGDRAEVEIVQQHARFVRARVTHLRHLSPQRLVPPCPFYWREEPRAAPQPECGGCQLQHIEYSMQCQSKRDFVVQALARIGGVADAEQLVAPCVASPQTFAYRNKADYVVAAQKIAAEKSEQNIGAPGTQTTIDHEPNSHAPNGQEPNGQEPNGQEPNGQEPNGQEPNGQAERKQENVQIGFFARDSHRLIDISRCLIQQEPNNLILEAVRESCAAGLAMPFDPDSGRGVLRRVIARTATNGEACLVAVTTSEAWPQEAEFARFMRQRVPQLVGVLRRTERGRTEHVGAEHVGAEHVGAEHVRAEHVGAEHVRAEHVGAEHVRAEHVRAEGSRAKRGRGGREETRLLDGRDWLEENVEGLSLRVRGDGFFQINSWTTPLLLQTALRLAQVQPGERVLDLYCGVGLFALAMARAGAQVLGIEQNRAAVQMARENANRNNLQAEFADGDTALVLWRQAQNKARSKRSKANVDLVVLDPPRAGAAPCLLEIVRLQPRRIVYVSCDCATLARDVRFLTAAGYRLAEIVPLDLFPQTAHVEAVARLERLD